MHTSISPWKQSVFMFLFLWIWFNNSACLMQQITVTVSSFFKTQNNTVKICSIKMPAPILWGCGDCISNHRTPTWHVYPCRQEQRSILTIRDGQCSWQAKVPSCFSLLLNSIRCHLLNNSTLLSTSEPLFLLYWIIGNQRNKPLVSKNGEALDQWETLIKLTFNASSLDKDFWGLYFLVCLLCQ